MQPNVEYLDGLVELVGGVAEHRAQLLVPAQPASEQIPIEGADTGRGDRKIQQRPLRVAVHCVQRQLGVGRPRRLRRTAAAFTGPMRHTEPPRLRGRHRRTTRLPPLSSAKRSRICDLQHKWRWNRRRRGIALCQGSVRGGCPRLTGPSRDRAAPVRPLENPTACRRRRCARARRSRATCRVRRRTAHPESPPFPGIWFAGVRAAGGGAMPKLDDVGLGQFKDQQGHARPSSAAASGGGRWVTDRSRSGCRRHGRCH